MLVYLVTCTGLDIFPANFLVLRFAGWLSGTHAVHDQDQSESSVVIGLSLYRVVLTYRLLWQKVIMEKDGKQEYSS